MARARRQGARVVAATGRSESSRHHDEHLQRHEGSAGDRHGDGGGGANDDVPEPRIASMDPEERRRRHALSYGLYNFKDVIAYYKRQHKWWSMKGPELSYDHYYIKPGKHPHRDVEGVDFFLGEEALVKYARSEGIFDDGVIDVETADTDEGATMQSQSQAQGQSKAQARQGSGQRHARSTSRARSQRSDLNQRSESESESESESCSSSSSSSSESSTSRRPKRKRVRQESLSRRHPPVAPASKTQGSNAQNAISLSSDTSENEGVGVGVGSVDEPMDESEGEESEWSASDAHGGFNQGDDDEEEQEEEEEEEENSDSSEDDLEAENVEVGDGGGEKSEQRRETTRRSGDGKGKAKARARARARARAAAAPHKAAGVGTSGSSYSAKEPRPLLKTANGKHKAAAGKQKEEAPATSAGANAEKKKKRRRRKPAPASQVESKASSHPSRSDVSKRRRAVKKSKSAPRDLLERLRGGERSEKHDTSFDLDVQEYGESPPRRPPTKARSTAARSGSGSARAVRPTPESQEEEEEKGTASEATNGQRLTGHSFMSASAVAASCASTLGSISSSDAETWLEVAKVALPPELAAFRVRVTVSWAKPPVYTIWLEQLSTQEQFQYSFEDIKELPREGLPMIPTEVVVQALVECLCDLPGAVVTVRRRADPKETSKIRETSKVELLPCVARQATDQAPATSGKDCSPTLTLRLIFPCYEMYKIPHEFPLALVSTPRRVEELKAELERTRARLVAVQSDRDRLSVQLQQLEEEKERAMAEQVAQVAQRAEGESARLRRDMQRQQDENVGRRATGAKEPSKKQRKAEERREREKERARRSVHLLSDWMLSFHEGELLVVTGANWQATDSTLPRKYVVEWRSVVELAEPLFRLSARPGASSSSKSTEVVTVVKSGTYQVNVNVAHDSLVDLRLVISSCSAESRQAKRREVAPTLLQIYDGKQRISRVDRMLDLQALDELELQLRPVDPSSPLAAAQENWLRPFSPPPNHLSVLFLDPQPVYGQVEDV